jgi:parallel beta-helix repeat protein
VKETQNKKLVIVVFAMLVVLGTMLTVAPVKAFGNTWYVPDAIKGIKTIQDAVNKVDHDDTIIVKPGTYPEHVYINRTQTNLEIIGKGAILDGLGCSLPYGFEINGTDGVTIKGFTIRHYSEAGIYIHADNSVPGRKRATLNTIRNNIIENNCGSGIAIGASDANTVKTNTVQHNGRIGVFIDDGRRNKIRSNTIYNNGWSGIEYHIAPNTEVKGNNVTYNGQDGLNADGYSGNSLIQGNVFDHNGWNGINMISGSNVIKGNNVSRNAVNGIMLAQGDDNVVWGNRIVLNGLDGVFVTYSWWNLDSSDRNSIRFNEVYGNRRHGIFVYTSDWNKVWNNTVIDNMGNGIQITAESPPYLAEYNTIYSNFVTPNGLANPLWYFDLYYDGWHGWNNNHWGVLLGVNDNNYVTWGWKLTAGTKPGPFPP